jgi:hypothetical protein
MVEGFRASDTEKTITPFEDLGPSLEWTDIHLGRDKGKPASAQELKIVKPDPDEKAVSNPSVKGTPLGDTTKGNLAPGQDVPIAAPKQTDTPTKPAETPPIDIGTVDKGVLKVDLSNKNLDLDKALARTDYKTIDLEGLDKNSVQYWVNKNGYFFWLETPEGKSLDGKIHYLPDSAQALCEHGKVINLEAQRLRANEEEANSVTGRNPYFEDLSRATPSSQKTVLMFGLRLAQMPTPDLELQERSLRAEAQAHPNNPYFRIMLSDVYFAQALKPLRDEYLATGKIAEVPPQTMQKIDFALQRLEESRMESASKLNGRNVVGDTMHPMRPYDLGQPGGEYAYWQGSYDQTMRRVQTLNSFRATVTTGALPSILSQPDVWPDGKIPRP